MTFFKNTRRNFIKGLTATSVLSATSIPAIARSLAENEEENRGADDPQDLAGKQNTNRPVLYDGPRSPLFDIIPFEGNTSFSSLSGIVSGRMAEAAEQAPVGQGTAWGIPFQIPERPVLVKDKSFALQITPVEAHYLCVPAYIGFY